MRAAAHKEKSQQELLSVSSPSDGDEAYGVVCEAANLGT
jgi:hypothetical protein